MATHVFLTIDTELMWRHHAAGFPPEEVIARSLEPAGVGIEWQLARLHAAGLKATFFVDPMPALLYGLGPIERVVQSILAAGQEVQLHLHANWTAARHDDRSAHSRADLIQYTLAEQLRLIEGARDLLIAAGAPRPCAFRAGSYAANDDTLTALAALGFTYDSSHNGSHAPFPSGISLSPRRISPVAHRGMVEVPVTLIADRAGRLRHFQVCALSAAEMRAALIHAATADHAAVTIVSHGFELATRAGTRPNGMHVRRFEVLCDTLAARADTLPTAHFADRPALSLDQDDQPLGPDLLRTSWRQAQQLWSNLVEERAA